MNQKTQKHKGQYVAPQMVIPKLTLESYKLLGRKNYKYSQRGTSRSYSLGDNKRVVEILNSKQFRDMFNEVYEPGEKLPSEQLESILSKGYEPRDHIIWGDTPQGPREISVIDSVVFNSIGLYQIRFTKNQKQRKQATRINMAFGASKLDDMSAQLFGDVVNPIESFLGNLPGMQILIEELKNSNPDTPASCVGEWLASQGITDCPISNQRIGQRAAELCKSLTGRAPGKKTVRVSPHWIEVEANSYSGIKAGLIGVAYRTLMEEYQEKKLGKPFFWQDEDGILCLSRDRF
ncbi:MAG: hypothetical protein F6K55_37675 [Moorea sp. SIO4A3]|nr:hypothetical protein [Moorena sp. SIO4A3]